MVKKIHLVFMSVLCVLLTGCYEEWQDDNRPIAKDDFAMIQLETEICRHACSEANCLMHLKSRIQ
jgi:hypothetical protein